MKQESPEDFLKKYGHKLLPGPIVNWPNDALLNTEGGIRQNLHNVLVALRGMPELFGVLSYDEMLCAPVLVAELPQSKGASPASRGRLPRPVIDEDVVQLQEWIQAQGLPNIGREPVTQALHLRSRESPFHRLKDWLMGLEWDGTPCLDNWVVIYLGAEDTEYHRAVGKMFLISMVARIFEPGCKVDYVVILEGAQGKKKSQALRILGGEWFSDSMPDIHTKDANQHLRGLWLIELGELSALARGAVELWKSFITRTTERYRPFFGRIPVIEPRQCVFAGTTNKEEYLQDATGNRRFWPIIVGILALAALERDREQLFAEAVQAYRRGEKWWPDEEFEQEHIVPQQDARLQLDVWESVISDWLDRSCEDDRVRIIDIARDALKIEDGRMGTAERNRIADVLTHLGWKRAKRQAKARYFVRPGTNAGEGENGVPF
jgi:predicted P-loop ATPase